MKIHRLGVLPLCFALAGCPGGSSNSSSTPPPLPALMSEADVLQLDATQAPIQTELANLAQDKSKRASLRYAALRRLEEKAPNTSVSVAEKLVMDPTQSEDGEFLRKNAIGVLVRSKSPDGQAALARVKASSLDWAVLAARLERKEAH